MIRIQPAVWKVTVTSVIKVPESDVFIDSYFLGTFMLIIMSPVTSLYYVNC